MNDTVNSGRFRRWVKQHRIALIILALAVVICSGFLVRELVDPEHIGKVERNDSPTYSIPVMSGSDRLPANINNLLMNNAYITDAERLIFDLDSLKENLQENADVKAWAIPIFINGINKALGMELNEKDLWDFHADESLIWFAFLYGDIDYGYVFYAHGEMHKILTIGEKTRYQVSNRNNALLVKYRG